MNLVDDHKSFQQGPGVEASVGWLKPFVNDLHSDLGLACAVIDAAGRVIFASPDFPRDDIGCRLANLPGAAEPTAFEGDSGERIWLALPVKLRRRVVATVLATQGNEGGGRIGNSAGPRLDRKNVPWLLRVLARQLNLAQTCAGQESDLEELGDRLLESYEEISLLYRLGQHFWLDITPEEVLATTCRDLRRRFGSDRTIACLVRMPGPDMTTESRRSISDGPLPTNRETMNRLLEWRRQQNLPFGQPLIDNDFRHQELLGHDRPVHLLLAPLCLQSESLGLLVAFGAADSPGFDSKDAQLLGNVATQTAAHWKSFLLFDELRQSLFSVIRTLVSAIEAKDPYTSGHSVRVGYVARRLADGLRLDREEVEAIYLSGLLHDIGKIGIREEVLQKPGKLSSEEWEHLKQHPEIGARILKPVAAMERILPGVRFHHESVDGSGYPLGLRGEQIPLMARIIAVADAFDAMSSRRPYRDARVLKDIRGIFESGSGTQWDSLAVSVLLRLLNDSDFLRDYSGPEMGPDIPLLGFAPRRLFLEIPQ